MCRQPVRIATFNVSMEADNYRSPNTNIHPEALRQHLASGTHPQIRNIAEIIQRVRPDIILLNEFDYITPQTEGLDQFQQHYLDQPQSGQSPIHYPYRFTAPVNTGVLMPVDQSGDGNISAPEDAYGFGHYPGQYGMAVLSQYPIYESAARTFQNFRWRDMPDARLPRRPDGSDYYTPEVMEIFRLSSKSHWDLPIHIGTHTLHLLASHPTPPVFDGPEDRNGLRNHDEIRLWVDYLNDTASYLYDDQGKRGGLSSEQGFVIAGDLNASPVQGDSHREIITDLIHHPRVQAVTPESRGATEARPDDPHAASHTVSWGLRADYVLPSREFTVIDSGVFWPSKDDPLSRLVEDRETSSDHRLVWVDICVGAEGGH